MGRRSRTRAADSEDHPADVLVVTDEEQRSDQYADWLDQEFDVERAASGEAALDSINADTDVVVLTRRLPDLLGDDVLGRIRDRGLDCRVVLVTTTASGPSLRQLDADAFLETPVSETDLLDVVDDVLTRSELERLLDDYLALSAEEAAIETASMRPGRGSDRRYDALADELNDRYEAFMAALLDVRRRPGTPMRHDSRRQIRRTLTGIGLVALVLVAIHILVPDAVQRLNDGGQQLSLLQGYVSSLVHGTDGHLFWNVVVFLTTSVITYALCLRLLAARWFQVTAAALVVFVPGTFPIATAITSGRAPAFVGFSHVVAGFIGFSILAFAGLLRLIYRPRSVLFGAGFVASVAGTLVLVVNNGVVPQLGAVGCVVTFAGFAFERVRAFGDGTEDPTDILANTGVIVGVGWIYGVLGLGLVSPGGTAFENISHLVGLGSGLIIAVLSAFVLNVLPVRRSLQRAGYQLPDRLL